MLTALAGVVAVRVTDERLKSDWRNWIADARDVNGRRNDIVHMQWLSSSLEGASDLIAGVQRGKKAGRQFEAKVLERTALIRLGDDADDLSLRLFGLIKETPGILA
jgi:hypothetical protein